MKRHYTMLALATLFFASCSKDEDTPRTSAPPATTTADPQQPSGNTTPPPPAGSPSLPIYTDDLQQGGVFLYPGGDNQVLDFADTSNPAAGARSIRYVWNGGDTAGQHVFVGMDLIHSGDLSSYNSTPGRDLRPGGYTKVTFNARGALGTANVLKIEVSDDGSQATAVPCLVLSVDGLQDDSTPGNPVASCTNKATLLSTWQTYTISVSNTDLAAVKDFFKSTYIYKGAGTGTGGTVFFDQILFQP